MTKGWREGDGLGLVKICIYMAMQSEAKTFLNNFNFVENKKKSPFSFKKYSFKNSYYDINMYVGDEDKKFKVQSVGTIPAAIAVDEMLRTFIPDLVINAGTAGGFKSRGASIGDVYIADKTQFHDRRIEIPGYPEYGCYLLNHSAQYHQKVIKQLGLKAGLLTTGDSLDYIEADKVLAEGNKAVIKDMEAAGIAWVCEHYNKPVIFIKSVTDIVDGPHATVGEFLTNLDQASKNLSKTLISLIDSRCI